MNDADFRMLRGRVHQLADMLGLEWKACPRNWSSYTEEERDKQPHGFGHCQDGLLEDGYADPRVCKTCQGAGVVLAQKGVDA